MTLAIVTMKIANHNLPDMTSLKITSAIMDVTTISKLFSNDTLAEFVPAIPYISNMGAAISRTTMAAV